ncbi:MAG: hypothetical protein WCW53_09255 [Syntrophales bacterium]|jgi:hypothetical protein
MRYPKLLKLIAVFVLVLGCVAVPKVHAATSFTQDLMLYDGDDRTIGVYILNLTPYKMTFDSSLVNNNMNGTPLRLKNITQQYRNGKDYEPFAPIGLPAVIPAAVPGVDLRPYPMAVSFLDAYDYVNAYSAIWWVNGVETKDENGRTYSGNAKLSINFNRPKPGGPLQSYLFKLVSDVVKECIEVVKLAADLESPLAWVDAFTGAVELAKEANEFSKNNSQNSGGDKMYVSSYVIAADGYGLPGTYCPPGYIPADDPYADDRKGTWADDAVITNQGDAGGYIQGSLVVVTQILRGRPGKDGQDVGTAPSMMVTVMKSSDYTTATTVQSVYGKTSYGDRAAISPGAKELRKILDQRGKKGKRDLLLLVRSLKKSQQDTLLKAALALHGKQKITPAELQKQEAMLTKVAGALKKNAKTI